MSTVKNLNQESYNPTCALSGRKDNLLMYAHRNEEGDMIGWIFLHEDIRPEQAGVKVRDYRTPATHTNP